MSKKFLICILLIGFTARFTCKGQDCAVSKYYHNTNNIGFPIQCQALPESPYGVMVYLTKIPRDLGNRQKQISCLIDSVYTIQDTMYIVLSDEYQGWSDKGVQYTGKILFSPRFVKITISHKGQKKSNYHLLIDNDEIVIQTQHTSIE